MSKAKHSVYSTYLTDILGAFKKCPKRQCKGTMIPVLSRYENNGTINHEQECSSCAKVIKDPRFKRDRNRRWERKPSRGKNENQPRSSRVR